MNDQQRTRLTATVSGTVQGVGFRYYTSRQALRRHLTGLASNQADGSVLVIAEGQVADVHSLTRWLESDATPGQVRSVQKSYSEPTGEFRNFRTE